MEGKNTRLVARLANMVASSDLAVWQLINATERGRQFRKITSGRISKITYCLTVEPHLIENGAL